MSFVQVGVALVIVSAFGTGIGIGVVMSTFLVSAQNSVSDNYQATVGVMIQLTRNMGGAIGILIFISIINLSNGSFSGAFQNGVLSLTLGISYCISG